MEPYADAGCVLKVNVHCDACKMKMMEILSAICGVYSVVIDAEEGTVKVNGEVDPNILMRALARSGKHAEVVWVKLNHPQLSNRSNSYRSLNYNNYSDNYGSYNNGIGYGHGHGTYGQSSYYPYGYKNAGLPESPCYDTHQQYYPSMKRSMPYPFGSSSCYGGTGYMAPPRNRSHYY